MAEKKETKTKEPKATESKEPLVEEQLDRGVEEQLERRVEEQLPRAKVPFNREGNFVFIGKKGAMAYVLAVVTQFSTGAKDVIVKARGKSISRAVDVAEIMRNRDTSVKVTNIAIATEEVVTQEGRPLKVSSIEITLKK